MRTAYVTFRDGGSEYVYKCPFAQAKVGDTAFVESNGLARVKIVRLNRHDNARATKSLIAIEDHEVARAAERKQEIVKELETMLARHKMIERFDPLRKYPVARRLLKELESL